jgi:hypothetical protein
LPECESQGFLDIPIFNPFHPEGERADLWMVASNAIASGSSVTLKDLPCFLQEHLFSPSMQIEQVMLSVKKICKRVCKAKKDLVHDLPMDCSIDGNVQVFPTANYSNPIAKNGEPLFEPPIHNHNSSIRNKVNLKHPFTLS